jgi:preprotein translocase subunit SecG
MGTVLIVIHLMVVVAMIGMVLLQRSEGGALGMGGGGGGGFMSARGAANALTRSTGILAVAFFTTSIALSILAKYEAKPTDVLDQVPIQTQTQDQGEGGVLDLLTPKKSESDNGNSDSTQVPNGN